MNNEQKMLEILAQMQADISEVKSDVSELKGDVSELKGDVSELKGDVSSLKQGQIEMNGRMDKLDSRMSSMETDVREIKHIASVTHENTKKIWSHLIEHQVKLWDIEGAISNLECAW